MYNVLIIGAGSIGALKDDKFDSPSNPEKVLTHAHGYYNNIDTNIVCVIDKDIKKATQAAEKWGCTWATNTFDLESVLTAMPIDIVSVCTPTETHLDVVARICTAEFKPKVIIVEKPCGSNYAECSNIVRLCKSAGIKLIVPYVRRFVPELRNIKAEIDQASVIYAINVWYNRGLKRDGCHALDFIFYLCDGILDIKETFADGIADYSDDDLTRGIIMNTRRCSQVVMHPVDGRVGSIFEMDIITDKGRYRLVDNFATAEYYPIEEEPVYGNYKRFDPTCDWQRTQLHRGLEFIIENAVDVINGGDILCGGIDALKVHEIIEEINRSK